MTINMVLGLKVFLMEQYMKAHTLMEIKMDKEELSLLMPQYSMEIL